MAAITGHLSTRRSYYMEVTWEIPNFIRISADRPEEDSRLWSPSFPLADACWRMELLPDGCVEDDSKGYIDIYLRRLNYPVTQQNVKVTFSLKTRQGKNFESYSTNKLYNYDDECSVTSYIERGKLEEKKKILLPDGTLSVLCQIIVEPSPDDPRASEDELLLPDFSMEGFETESLPCNQLDSSFEKETKRACSCSLHLLDASSVKAAGDLQKTAQSVHTLQLDFKKLRESEEDSDVCLKVSDKEFRAHKCILRARSSVFSAMFKHDTEEKNNGEVVIEDLDPESFPDFLQHVYSGSVDILSVENVFNLYIASDKYDMGDLKAECKSYMESTLSVDTFCDVMVVALRYKEDELLKLAIDFFSKNLTKIIVTVKWQKFLEGHVTAGNELFIKALVPSTEE